MTRAIETRANEYAKEKVRRFFGEESWLNRVECGVMAESAYKAGAESQHEIDIDKAWDYLLTAINELYGDFEKTCEFLDKFLKAMEE